MTKILLPTPDAPPMRGGVARVIGAILRLRPEVVLHTLPEREGTLGVLKRLWSVARGYDEIWTHHVVPVGTACYFLSFVRRMPYGVFLHGLDFDLVRRNVWKRFLARRILRRARALVTNSEALRGEVSVFTGRDDVQVLHPCVLGEFEQASMTTRKGLVHHTPGSLAKMFATQLAASAGAGVSMIKKDSEEHVMLLTVARLVERKGHRKVLEAMKDIPNVAYTIVGDGPLREELETLARELGIARRVSFMPQVADAELPAIYAAHDIFVMPTTRHERDREGFGIVYAEAGLFGLPCIATDIPGVDEVLVHEETGLLIADASHALAEAIKKLVAMPSLRLRMGSAARARILERFTEQHVKEKLLKI